eukprot:4062933-Prymnesium_polylepis.1
MPSGRSSTNPRALTDVRDGDNWSSVTSTNCADDEQESDITFRVTGACLNKRLNAHLFRVSVVRCDRPNGRVRDDPVRDNVERRSHGSGVDGAEREAESSKDGKVWVGDAFDETPRQFHRKAEHVPQNQLRDTCPVRVPRPFTGLGHPITPQHPPTLSYPLGTNAVMRLPLPRSSISREVPLRAASDMRLVPHVAA